MIEFLSNFFLKYKFDDEYVPDNTIQYTVNTDDNLDEKIKHIFNHYKDCKPIVIVYYCKNDIKYFLSVFTKNFCNIRKRSEFEDMLLMNDCIFL
jgi:hypothetical protein